MGQMIAELKNGLKADRMSCNKFSANHFRLYLHCVVYVILHSFQADMLAGTGLECSTITTIREKTAPERGFHRREEDLHTPSILTDGSDAS